MKLYPPSNQFKKPEKGLRSTKLFATLGTIALVLLLFIGSLAGRKEFNSPHKFAIELLGTAQYGLTGISNYFASIWSGYIALFDLREENIKLKQELDNYKILNSQFMEAAATNVRLEKLLGLKDSIEPPNLTVQIIGKDPSIWFKTVTIDHGSSDGIKKGMPAVIAEGVVGQVVNTSPNYAKVLLANDPNSAIDILIQSSRIQGIIKGSGNNNYKLHYVLTNNIVQKNDRLITSGLGGTFPKGIPVGYISRIIENKRGMFHEIEVTPSVDFTLLEYLIIILTEDSLLE
jgi:rod shape-determining protein MreC